MVRTFGDPVRADAGTFARLDRQIDRLRTEPTPARAVRVARTAAWRLAFGVRLGDYAYGTSYQATMLPRPRVWENRLKPRNAGVASLSIPSDSTSTAWTTK